MNTLITIHSVAALANRAIVTYVRCNIPIENKALALEIYGDDELWHIEEHSTPYSTKVVATSY